LGGVRRNGREGALEGRVIVDLVPDVPPEARARRGGERASGRDRDRGRCGRGLPIDGRSGYPQGGAGCVIHGPVELHVALYGQWERCDRRANAKVPTCVDDCFYVIDIAPELGDVTATPLVHHQGRVVARLNDLEPRPRGKACIVNGHVPVVVLVQAVGQVFLGDRNGCDLGGLVREIALDGDAHTRLDVRQR